jgi:hypothetical protein
MRTHTSQHAWVQYIKKRTNTAHCAYSHYVTCVGTLRKKRTTITHYAYLFAILSTYFNTVGVSRLEYEELFAFP